MKKIINLKNLLPLAFVLPLFFFGFLHAYSYKIFQPDDAFIYLVYVKSFLDGNGLTYNGVLVEGFSSALWTILVARLAWLGVDPLFASKLIGWTAYLSIGLMLFSTNRIFKNIKISTNLLTLSLFFSFPALALWASGALETLLYAALIFAASLFYFRARFLSLESNSFMISGVLFGLISLTRPEGFALIGVVFVFELIMFLHKKQLAVNGVLRLIFAYGIITISIFLLRHTLYGEWFPNTVSAKTGNLLWQIQIGYNYIISFLINYWLFVLYYVMAFGYVILNRKVAEREYFFALLSFVVICGYSLFTLMVGGDWMLGWRFLIPTIPFYVITIGIAFGKVRWVLAMVMSVPLLIFLLFDSYSLHSRAMSQASSDTGDILMGKYIKTLNLSPKEKIAVIDAGAIPYFSGQPTIDMIGLNDRYISKIKGGFLQKYDNQYVLDQNPKIIQFHTKYVNKNGDVAPTEAFRGAISLFYNSEFQKKYILDKNSPIPHLFIRRDQVLDRTFLDTFFDSELTGEYAAGKLKIKLRKTGDGVWVAQDSEYLQAGAVYLQLKVFTSNQGVIQEKLIPIQKNMTFNDEVIFDFTPPFFESHLSSYKMVVCPVVLGVKEMNSCNNGKAFEWSYLSDQAVLGRGLYRYDNPNLILEGWSSFEKTHVWSLGYHSKINFITTNDKYQKIKLKLAPFGVQNIKVSLNNVQVFKGNLEKPQILTVDAFALREGRNVLEIFTPGAKFPSKEDPRLIGVALEEFELD